MPRRVGSPWSIVVAPWAPLPGPEGPFVIHIRIAWMCIRRGPDYGPVMQLDDLLQRYFATSDLTGVAPDTLSAGIEHCRVDLGLEEDRGKRFALWSFLHMFGSAPDLDVAF